MGRRVKAGRCLLTLVWLLGNLGCTGDPVPSPKHDPKHEESPLVTPKELADQALSLWQRDIDQYRRHTKDPQSVRPKAEEFMRAVQLNMLPHPRGPRREKTAEMGKKLVEQGCQDPLVKTYYGKAICSAEGPYPAIPVILAGLNSWTSSGYPGEGRRLGVFTLFAEAKLHARMLSWPRLREEAAYLAAWRAGDETIAPEMRRVLYHELLPLTDDDCGGTWEDSVAVYEACSKRPKADPWLVHMLAGRAYVARAWHHRGGEWAYKVTPEGWKLFHENLQKAALEYAEAMKLHPENPEAACGMIVIAMAGESDESPQEWFDKAVATEFDYMPAYDKLRWALRPRWGGSHEAMYKFGCRCADTQRYETNVPLMLLWAVDDIDQDSESEGGAWRREGVYTRIKTLLEAMANDPSRVDDSGVFLGKSGIMTLHALMAERAGEFADARRLVDQLGDRFDRATFDRWCRHPEWELTRIYAFSGKGADHLDKAWQTIVEAPKPVSDQVLRKAKSLYEKALAADDNERSQAFCRTWINEMEGRLAFGAGQWNEKDFDSRLLGWSLVKGTWSMENERTAVGLPGRVNSRVLIQPSLSPMFPLEIEFDIETPTAPRYPVELGLFLPEANNAPHTKKAYQRFYIRTRDNQAGIEIGEEKKTVPCELKPVNRIRVQLADGHAVLHVNDRLCLEHHEADFHPQPAFNVGCYTYVLPDLRVRVSNMRFRRWEPPKEESAKQAAGTAD